MTEQTVETFTGDAEVVRAIRSSLAHCVREKLGGYSSPLDPFIKAVVAQNGLAIQSLINKALEAAVSDPEFTDSIKDSVRAKLASLLVSKFGGEMEKHVNELKASPATRARITLAIESIVAGK